MVYIPQLCGRISRCFILQNPRELECEREERSMLSDNEVELALSEVGSHLTRALEGLGDVPREAFAHPDDRLRLQELIAQAGQIVASELAKRSWDE
jgi:hypothetical protein